MTFNVRSVDTSKNETSLIVNCSSLTVGCFLEKPRLGRLEVSQLPVTLRLVWNQSGADDRFGEFNRPPVINHAQNGQNKKAMFFYSFNFILLIASAIFYYRAAESEGSSCPLWTGLSILISVLIWWVLGWGLLAMLLGQVGLFVGITVVRTMRKS